MFICIYVNFINYIYFKAIHMYGTIRQKMCISSTEIKIFRNNKTCIVTNEKFLYPHKKMKVLS